MITPRERFPQEELITDHPHHRHPLARPRLDIRIMKSQPPDPTAARDPQEYLLTKALLLLKVEIPLQWWNAVAINPYHTEVILLIE